MINIDKLIRLEVGLLLFRIRMLYRKWIIDPAITDLRLAGNLLLAHVLPVRAMMHPSPKNPPPKSATSSLPNTIFFSVGDPIVALLTVTSGWIPDC